LLVLGLSEFLLLFKLDTGAVLDIEVEGAVDTRLIVDLEN
jgi:hypothetical protein